MPVILKPGKDLSIIEFPVKDHLRFIYDIDDRAVFFENFALKVLGEEAFYPARCIDDVFQPFMLQGEAVNIGDYFNRALRLIMAICIFAEIVSKNMLNRVISFASTGHPLYDMDCHE
jgi:hypothetical protein